MSAPQSKTYEVKVGGLSGIILAIVVGVAFLSFFAFAAMLLTTLAIIAAPIVGIAYLIGAFD